MPQILIYRRWCELIYRHHSTVAATQGTPQSPASASLSQQPPRTVTTSILSTVYGTTTAYATTTVYSSDLRTTTVLSSGVITTTIAGENVTYTASGGVVTQTISPSTVFITLSASTILVTPSPQVLTVSTREVSTAPGELENYHPSTRLWLSSYCLQ